MAGVKGLNRPTNGLSAVHTRRVASEALVDVVADELDRMARRDGDSSLELPELRKIWARSHSGEWDAAAAERVLRDGIEALDGPFGKLSKTEAALILFNLDAHAEAEADYEVVLGRLGRMAGIAGDVAIRARTAELRRSLAAVLVGQDVRIKVESRDNVASLLANLDAVEVPAEPDAAGLRRYEDPRALPPNFVGDRYYVFPGGCITYRFAFTEGGSFREVVEVTDALSFVSRAEGVEALQREGLVLCGRGTECPG